MNNFPAPMGSLPMGGKKRVFNPSKLNQPTDDLPLEVQYSRAKTDEERIAIYEKERLRVERERASDRLLIC